MNDDILFEIAKYMEKKTGIAQLDQAFESSETFKRNMNNFSETLEKWLPIRPKIEELEYKNIIKKTYEKEYFDYIHEVLRTIDFKATDKKVSPKIASIVKSMDFKLKKMMIMRKLNIKK